MQKLRISRDFESLRQVLRLVFESLRLLFGHLLFGQSERPDDFGVVHNEQVYVGGVCFSQSGSRQSSLARDLGIPHTEQV